MAFEDGRLLAAVGVPQPRRVVVRRGHHALAVGAEGRARHEVSMAFEDRGLLAAIGVPQSRGVVEGLDEAVPVICLQSFPKRIS